MQLGNAAWGLRETPLEQQLAITAAMELDLLELSIAGYDRDYLQLDAGEAKIAETANLFRKYNVRLDCACTGNDFTGDDASEQLVKVKTVIDIASKLGVKFLRIFGGFRSDSAVIGSPFTRMLDCLRAAAEYAAPRGVTLAVETHGGVMNNGDALVHFASATTRIDWWEDILATGVLINYDPANFAATGATDPIAFYNRFKNAIKYVHLKDFRSVEGGVLPAACGEGRLNWPVLMAALADYTGPALIEYELPGDVEDGLRRSLAFLKQFR